MEETSGERLAGGCVGRTLLTCLGLGAATAVGLAPQCTHDPTPTVSRPYFPGVNGKTNYGMIQVAARPTTFLEEYWYNKSVPSELVVLRDFRDYQGPPMSKQELFASMKSIEGPIYIFATEKGRELMQKEPVKSQLPSVKNIYSVTPQDFGTLTPQQLMDSVKEGVIPARRTY